MRLPSSRTCKPVVTLLLAAGATAAYGGPVRRWLTSNGRLDVPNHRSSHNTPVPRGGGVAVLLGATTAATITKQGLPAKSVLSIAGLSALGWLDDVTGHVPTGARLIGQLGAGAFGLGWNLVDVPVAALTTAGVVNVFNFMDGINGISGLTAAVWGINAMLLEESGGHSLATIGALTAGAGLGFLPHNAPRARLFLGDVGSYSIGAAMAAGILGQQTLTRRYRVAAPLMLYAVDAAQALVRRTRAGQPLTQPHRDHVYQVLVDQGASHTEVALFHASASATVGIAAQLSTRWGVALTASTCVLYLTAPRLRPKSELSKLAPHPATSGSA